MKVFTGWKDALRRLFARETGRCRPAAQGDPAEIVRAFEQCIDLSFHDPRLLQRALTHRSFLAGEESQGPDSNERLEFLGDAVLELIVIEHLYRRFPQNREGELTQKKSLLVSRSVLADRAELMGLGRFILLSVAEGESGGRERRSILADAFEATLGAIYCDLGLEAARLFVERWLLNETDRILQDSDKQNFKSILQEQVQAEFRIHPRYRVAGEEGPDHDKRFTVQVVVGGRVLGTGRGSNKKEAEQHAARDALSAPALSRRLREMGDG
jgi:ribonuclease-3